MRRPQGFDRPAVRPPSPQPDRMTSAPRSDRRASVRDARRPTQPDDPGTSGQAAASGRADRSVREATTEPIAVVPAASITAPSATRTMPGVEAGESGPRPLTPVAARRQLRAARRARKQYEREEVRRFTWRARRRRRAWLAAAAVVAALVLFVVVGAYSPVMALRTIEVVGANRVSAAEIQAALDDQLGTPLPLLDVGAVERELASFALIRSYVTESRPPATLVVRIVEREPVGLVPSAAGFDLVDAAGVVIQGGPERVAGYPIIQSRNGAGSAGFAAAADVIAALPGGIRSQLDTITAATKDDVTLTLAGGARVVWGSAEESAYKAVVLGALMVGHPVGSVAEYDVSSPDTAVLR